MLTPASWQSCDTSARCSYGWIVPPPKLCVFSIATAAVDTKYGPASGAMMPAIVAASATP